MCSVCWKTPCDARCPNADAPRVLEECYNCHNEIVAGDKAFEFQGVYYCRECLDEVMPEILDTYFGDKTPENEDAPEEAIATCPACQSAIMAYEEYWTVPNLPHHKARAGKRFHSECAGRIAEKEYIFMRTMEEEDW